MDSRRCVAITLVLFVCSAVAARAQVITFAQISAPHFFTTNTRSKDAGAWLALRNRLAFLETVARLNRLAQAGSRLDFVVISGDLDVRNIDAAEIDIRAADFARILAAVLTPRIVLLPGEGDVSPTAPGTRREFDRFVDQMRRALYPDRQVVDLTRTTLDIEGIRVVGLDSLPFVSLPGQMPAAHTQCADLERVRQAIGTVGRVIVFTHTPPIEVPSPDGAKKVSLWSVTSPARRPLRDLAQRRGLVAIFGGHVESSASDFFTRPYPILPTILGELSPPPVWVGPSSGRTSHAPGRPEPRGFLVATVSGNGEVTPTAHWLPEPSSSSRDKQALLAKALAHVDAGELDQAATTYQEALGSTDSAVRRAALEGFLRARRDMDTWRWRLDPITGYIGDRREILLAAFVVVGIWAAWTFSRAPIVDPPIKLTTDAPAEWFVAELLAAIPEAQRMLAAEDAAVVVDAQGADLTLTRPLFLEGELKKLIDELPGLGPAKVGGVVDAVLKMIGLLRRRLRIEVSGTKDDVRAFAMLGRAGIVVASWRAPSDADEALAVPDAARQMAYNVMWELRKK